MGVTSYPGNIAQLSSRIPRRPPSVTVMFGVFELDIETGELWKHGVRRKLQQKPLQILRVLLEKPGELVTREELRQTLWSDGTFVDFESGLNTAINRLRAALGDSAEAPQFIETLPRLGYRFICPTVRTLVSPEAGHCSVPEPTPVNPVTIATSDSGPHRRLKISLQLYIAALSGLAVIAVCAVFYLRNQQRTGAAQPSFRQLTFRTGTVDNARFIPGSEQITYTAKWQGGTRQSYVLNLQDLSTSAVNNSYNPQTAALVRSHGTESAVEFPSGHVVYTSKGWITDLKVSPRGDRVAFLEHPVRDDDGGYLRVVDRKGAASAWTPFWSSVAGLAWSSSGNEVWFTASAEGTSRALFASSGPGAPRLISQGPSSLRILDISQKGQALVALDDIRMSLTVALPGQATESDLSKFDCSHADDISPDGRYLLFTEGSSAAGKHYTSYIHDLNSHTTTRLAQGRGMALSPDSKWAITIDPEDRHALVIHSREDGKARVVYGNGFEYQWAKFLPTGRELIVGGAYPGKPLMICRQLLQDGSLRPITGVPYMDYVALSFDGSEIAGMLNGQAAVFHLLSGKLHKILPDMRLMPVAWSEDSHSLYCARLNGQIAELLKVDAETGQAIRWKTISPNGTVGFAGLASVVAAPEAEIYAYSTHLHLSRLYTVDGWR